MGELVDYNIAKLNKLIEKSIEQKSKSSENWFREILANYKRGVIDIHWISGRLRVEKKVGPGRDNDCAKTPG